MRNIFLFVRRYFNLLFFLLLQGFCIYLIVHYNTYHNAVFSGTANQLTGKINEQYNKVEDYFHLKKTNDSLWKANEQLYNKLKADFQLPDTTSKTVLDTIKIDSLTQYRRYAYLRAAVIENAVNTQSNFIVVARGKAQQLKEGMGLVDINNATVGVITAVTDDYAVAMSLLHKDSHIDGKLLKSGETGTISWDGAVPNIVSINRIPKSAKVAKGDTIITSGNSTYFPRGMIIGYVTEVLPEKSSNNYAIKLKTAADFYSLQYVFAIDNKQQEAIDELLEKAKHPQTIK
ncbi:rod shape-determining protein MreC [Ferruginibacter sp. SUN106]|uniref:rod shape-determining protein MreC n=1 Tax=Ferruginibacter sp. SUN106 TaxID=2978348 RepID=UPI003D36865C